MVLMIMQYRISHTHSCGFISFQNTRKCCLNFVGYTTPTIFRNYTGHSKSHWCFQLLTRVLDGFLEFLILTVHERNSTQFSCVFRPLLLLLQLGILSHWLPWLWPWMIWLGCKLCSRQSPPDQVHPSGAFSSSRVNCVKPVQGSDKFREPSMFQ